MRSEVITAKAAARTDGVLTRRRLLALGLTDNEVDHGIRRGLWLPVHAGVLQHAAVPMTERTRLRAALEACGPTAVASHRCAANLWELRVPRRVRPEITVATTVKPKLPDVEIHRTTALEPIDVRKIDGLRRTSVARTLLDLGAVLRYPAVERAAQDAVIRKLVAMIDLICLLDRIGGRGRRGTASLREVVLSSLPDERLASQLEHAFHQLLLDCEIEPPVLQHELTCADGRLVRLDFAWPDRRVAAETDGRRWHATRTDFEDTMARSNSIERTGWAHYRYGWSAVHDTPRVIRAELTAALAPAS